MEHAPGRADRLVAGRSDTFVVHRSGPLQGTVTVGGAKNSVLKLMAACILAEGHHVLTNVPDIVDVEIMGEILGALGMYVVRRGHELFIDTPADITPRAPYALADRLRASW